MCKGFFKPLYCVVRPLEELPVRHPALVPHLRADRVGLGVAESRTSAVSLVRQTDGDEAKGRLHSGDAAHALEVRAASHLLCTLFFCQIMVCLTICFFLPCPRMSASWPAARRSPGRRGRGRTGGSPRCWSRRWTGSEIGSNLRNSPESMVINFFACSSLHLYSPHAPKEQAKTDPSSPSQRTCSSFAYIFSVFILKAFWRGKRPARPRIASEEQ